MKHVLVTGANGFVGQALVRRLARQPGLALTLIDRQFDDGGGAPPDSRGIRRLRGSFGDPAMLAQALEGWGGQADGAAPVDTVFHLASVPGALAENDYALGCEVNLRASLALAEQAARTARPHGTATRFVFASTVAVYGALGTVASEDDALAPLLSYGAHKAILEIALADLHRRGALDVASLRLPGIVARPPAPSGHGSAFMSMILHRLAAGQPYVCPVSPNASAWWMSLPCCIDNLLHAATMPRAPFPACTWQLPVLWLTVREVVAAMAAAHGPQCHALLSYQPDAGIEQLFGRLPPLHTPRAWAAGFRADADAAALVRDGLFIDGAMAPCVSTAST